MLVKGNGLALTCVRVFGVPAGHRGIVLEFYPRNPRGVVLGRSHLPLLGGNGVIG